MQAQALDLARLEGLSPNALWSEVVADPSEYGPEDMSDWLEAYPADEAIFVGLTDTVALKWPKASASERRVVVSLAYEAAISIRKDSLLSETKSD
jgi:hypothetical protein